MFCFAMTTVCFGGVQMNKILFREIHCRKRKKKSNDRVRIGRQWDRVGRRRLLTDDQIVALCVALHVQMVLVAVVQHAVEGRDDLIAFSRDDAMIDELSEQRGQGDGIACLRALPMVFIDQFELKLLCIDLREVSVHLDLVVVHRTDEIVLERVGKERRFSIHGIEIRLVDGQTVIDVRKMQRSPIGKMM